eukprot:Gregarina_sp_Poly_1__1081@NODE_1264_length_4570_cov_95_245614_g859_i0_p4_GENE_NODE_1264_length_4570_cov_95_245614_g859_i0NODE_1264_length_4570_cov_95_245614_g859_i0_p4_ORF_typecomplete_len245_score21_40_NODE_1264_length_4570_cov_95_245614_g859_i016202354
MVLEIIESFIKCFYNPKVQTSNQRNSDHRPRSLGQLYLGNVCGIAEVGNHAGSAVVSQANIFCRILSFLPIQPSLMCRRLNSIADRNITFYYTVDSLAVDEVWYPGWDKFLFHGGRSLEAVICRSSQWLRRITARANFSVPLEVFGALLVASAPTLETLEVTVTVDKLPFIPVEYINALTDAQAVFPKLTYIRWQVLDRRNIYYLPFPFMKRNQCPNIQRLELDHRAFASLCHWDSQWEDSSSK